MEVITYNFAYHDQLANSCKASEAFHQRTFVQVAKSFLFKVNSKYYIYIFKSKQKQTSANSGIYSTIAKRTRHFPS